MPVKNETAFLQSLSHLVSHRAVKYHCGFRTAFVQWTSEEEKQGVSYTELRDFVVSAHRGNEVDS
ncbi:hypothetical protein [Planococcus beigongshangi]|uniref:hypothetical protein n=1 Tax=Planococcus beigongshangi TaxID=2782536 RepID=UPI00193C019A|nr:hypothetical protein [Planococcus beigongshangi]